MMSKLDLKITAWKFVKNSVYVVLAGLAIVYGNSYWYAAICPVLVSIENILKNC